MADRKSPVPWGVLAEFAGPEPLLEAVRSLRQQGFGPIETFTPFPIGGLEEAIGFRSRLVPAAFLFGGAAGAVIGFGMQVWVNLIFPLWIGGRPLISIPAFMLITFELMVLCSVAAGILAMLIGNRLPRLNHPVFEAERFSLAEERYFLAILAGADFDRHSVGKALARLDPVSITDIAAEAA